MTISLLKSFPTKIVRNARVNLKVRALNAPSPMIDYGTFVRRIENKEIESVTLSQSKGTASFVAKDDSQGNANIILTESLIEDMVKNDVNVFVAPPDVSNATIISNIILGFIVIPALFFSLRNIFAARNGGNPMGPMGMGNAFQFNSDMETGVTFSDVAGIDEVTNEIYEIVEFLKDPSAFNDAGAKIPTGALLYGKPGTGKTLIAKAIAGEAGVPFLSCSSSQFIELFVGVGAQRIRSMFKAAREHSPCIVFIDEIDAIGKKRGQGFTGGNDEREQTLNQLLTEMDGFTENTGVIVIGATNRLDVLDDALVRPGRFDRKIYVPLPNREGRKKILDVHLKNKILCLDTDLDAIAAKTSGSSGADLMNIINEAAINAAREKRIDINSKDIDNALEKVMIGLPQNTIYTDEQKTKIAYHEAGHALLGYLLSKRSQFDTIDKVSILPRGSTGGVTIFVPDSTSIEGWYTKEYLQNKMIVALGGHASEEIIYGKKLVSTGAVSDFKQVTSIAYNMVTDFGFSQNKMSYADVNISDGLRKDIDDEVKKIVKGSYDVALSELERYKDQLIAIANKLVAEETIYQSDIEEIVTTSA